MSKNTTLDENDNRCIYCGAAIESSAIELVPDVDDVEAWLALATHHESDCEWVCTRAHREAEEDDYEAEEYDELYWREEEADATVATSSLPLLGNTGESTSMHTKQRTLQRGFYIAPAHPDMTITVENAVSGNKLVVHENGIGGLAADMKPNHLYKVTGTNTTGITIGFYLFVSEESISNPFNFFVQPEGGIHEEDSLRPE